MSREEWLAARPVLSSDDEVALEAWRFCGGWEPERIPLAAAYYGVADLPDLIDKLMVIRDRIEMQTQTEREAKVR